MKSILIIDDDEGFIDNLCHILTFCGYHVFKAITGRDGLEMLNKNHYDLILLDLGLPDLDGLDILKEIRLTTNIRVIIITACQDIEIKKSAFSCCADDYLTKPFDIDELELRIQNALDHTRTNFDKTIFAFADFVVDFESHEIHKVDQKIPITRIELTLLSLFINNADRCLSCDCILNAIWDRVSCDNTELVRTNILKLRNKIEPDPKNPKYIVTVPTAGYRFIPHQLQ